MLHPSSASASATVGGIALAVVSVVAAVGVLGTSATPAVRAALAGRSAVFATCRPAAWRLAAGAPNDAPQIVACGRCAGCASPATMRRKKPSSSSCACLLTDAGATLSAEATAAAAADMILRQPSVLAAEGLWGFCLSSTGVLSRVPPVRWSRRGRGRPNSVQTRVLCVTRRAPLAGGDTSCLARRPSANHGSRRRVPGPRARLDLRGPGAGARGSRCQRRLHGGLAQRHLPRARCSSTEACGTSTGGTAVPRGRELRARARGAALLRTHTALSIAALFFVWHAVAVSMCACDMSDVTAQRCPQRPQPENNNSGR